MQKSKEQLLLVKCFNCTKLFPQCYMTKLTCSHVLCSNCIGLLFLNNAFNNNHIDFKNIRYCCFCSKGIQLIK